MSLHVQREVVAAGKTPRAVAAFEGLGAGVFPVVARQLVRPREAPAAALPAAVVRLFACGGKVNRRLEWNNIRKCLFT